MRIIKFDCEVVIDGWDTIAEFHQWLAHLYPNYFGIGENIQNGNRVLLFRNPKDET